MERILISLLAIWGAQSVVAACFADWPQYRGEMQRTAYVAQDMEGINWQPAWSLATQTAASPTWPKPARGSLWQSLEHIEARVNHDRGDHPLIAADQHGKLHVLLALGGGDRLLSIDPVTGRVEWQFYADAPIRYAPCTGDGKLWFGSDDGKVRALDIATGKVLWEYRIGPDWKWIIGNGRLISPHPIRTSLMLVGDRIMATAGLFPSQGVYAVALEKDSGKLLWRTRLQQSPQGYSLSAGDERLILPSGRSQPFMLDVETGETLAQLPSPGGSFCMVTEQGFFAGPGNSPRLSLYSGKVRSSLSAPRMLPFQGNLVATAAGLIWNADVNQLTCRSLTADGTTDELWTCQVREPQAMIASGLGEQLQVFVAMRDAIEIIDGRRGETFSTLSVNELLNASESIQSLAVSAAKKTQPAVLIAVTSAGRVISWIGKSTALGQQHDAEFVSVDSLASKTLPTNRPIRLAIDRFINELNGDISTKAKGFGLILRNKGESHQLTPNMWYSITKRLLGKTDLKLVVVSDDLEVIREVRTTFSAEGAYGSRVSAIYSQEPNELPFEEKIFNACFFELGHSGNLDQEKLSLCLAETGVLAPLSRSVHMPTVSGRSRLQAGTWLHQYGNTNNTSSTTDSAVGAASRFKLRWFGGVGPSRMPDRHLRGPAPLAARNTMIIHGDGVLIGVDPANGTERWQLPLPERTMRYVMPFDGGFSSLSPDGETLWTVVGKEVWQIAAITGKIECKIPVPEDHGELRWGYMAESGGSLFATLMKENAPRLELERKEARASYTDLDYRSSRPLVCSRLLISMSLRGDSHWGYRSDGVIPHGSISVDSNSDRMVFVEGLSDECVQHKTDRITAKAIAAKARVVCLSTASGETKWSSDLAWPQAENILYTQLTDKHLVLVSSRSSSSKADYFVRVHDATSGEVIWEDEHTHVRNGLYHGEQIHHPLLLRATAPIGGVPAQPERLVVEPFIYELATGERLLPPGTKESWALVRPGHSCGTLSGTGNCIFFRASNPTVFNLTKESQNAFTALSPSRPSCWINMIPATGLLLIPEGSASCVCSYSLQTSMAFAPVARELSDEEFFLADYPKLAAEPLAELHAWDLPAELTKEKLPPKVGEWALQPVLSSPDAPELAAGFDGQRWFEQVRQEDKLLRLPKTLTVAGWVKVGAGNANWSGILSAIEDNGNYERGMLLGLKDDRFVFGITSTGKQRLTYLTDSSLALKDKWIHLAGTYDGLTMNLFVDGRLRAVSTAQRGAVSWDRNATFALGAYVDQNEKYPFHGQIHSISLYRGALPAARIRELAEQRPASEY